MPGRMLLPLHTVFHKLLAFHMYYIDYISMILAKTKIDKNPSVSVTQNVTVARSQVNSRPVVNQLTNVLNAPKPTAAMSLLATVI